MRYTLRLFISSLLALLTSFSASSAAQSLDQSYLNQDKPGTPGGTPGEKPGKPGDTPGKTERIVLEKARAAPTPSKSVDLVFSTAASSAAADSGKKATKTSKAHKGGKKGKKSSGSTTTGGEKPGKPGDTPGKK